MSKSNNVTNWYSTVFKTWHEKQLGKKPDATLLDAAHKLGLRPGKQALANAMAMRDGGVSGAQIVMACGAPQLNRMRGLIQAGVVKREAVPPNDQGHAVYKISLTAKGQAAIKRAAEAADKAVLADADKAKAKHARKAAKRKPAKVPAPVAEVVAEQPQGDSGNVPAEQPQA